MSPIWSINDCGIHLMTALQSPHSLDEHHKKSNIGCSCVVTHLMTHMTYDYNSRPSYGRKSRSTCIFSLPLSKTFFFLSKGIANCAWFHPRFFSLNVTVRMTRIWIMYFPTELEYILTKAPGSPHLCNKPLLACFIFPYSDLEDCLLNKIMRSSSLFHFTHIRFARKFSFSI